MVQSIVLYNFSMSGPPTGRQVVPANYSSILCQCKSEQVFDLQVFDLQYSTINFNPRFWQVSSAVELSIISS